VKFEFDLKLAAALRYVLRRHSFLLVL